MGSDGIYGEKAKSKRCVFRCFLKIAMTVSMGVVLSGDKLSSIYSLVLVSKALYHTCFICGQRCKRWSRRPKLTSSVISDVKPIIYIYITFTSWVLPLSVEKLYETHWWTGECIEKSDLTSVLFFQTALPIPFAFLALLGDMAKA